MESILIKVREARSMQQKDYTLIIECNETISDIDEEIFHLFKKIKDGYNKYFPELEAMNLSPAQYAKTVARIGYSKDISRVDFSDILPSSIVLVVIMSAASSKLYSADDIVISQVLKQCEHLLHFENVRMELTLYIESQMMHISPNLSIIIGSSTAAKLIGAAGSVQQLANIPSGYLQTMGSDNNSLAGFGRVGGSTKYHMNGIIAQCELVKQISSIYHKQAIRIIASKCTLAARFDASNSHDTSYGALLKNEIEKKLEKLQEPLPNQGIKALAAPKEYSKKKRGGKRVRKLKEQVSMTHLAKLQNRMAFGEPEEQVIQGESVKGLGLLKGTSSGIMTKTKIGADIKQRERLKQRASLLLPDLSTNRQGSFNSLSGFASSFSFASQQGIQLQNPDQTKDSGNTSRYFESSSQKTFNTLK